MIPNAIPMPSLEKNGNKSGKLSKTVQNCPKVSSVKRLEYAGQGAQAKRPKPLGGLAARTSQPAGAGGPPGPPWGTTAMAAKESSAAVKHGEAR